MERSKKMFASKILAVVGVGDAKKSLVAFIKRVKGKVTSSVNTKTFLLITEDQQLVATSNAKKHNIPIFSVHEFKLKYLESSNRVLSNNQISKRKASESSNENLKPNSPKKRVLENKTSELPSKCDNLTFINNVGELSKFENRQEQSQQIAEALLEQKSSPKGVLPILSQHVESDKDGLVANFRSVLKDQCYKSDDPNYDKLMKAALVRVDMTNMSSLSSMQSNLAKGSIRNYLYHDIQEALSKLIENDNYDSNLKRSLDVISNVIYPALT